MWALVSQAHSAPEITIPLVPPRITFPKAGARIARAPSTNLSSPAAAPTSKYFLPLQACFPLKHQYGSHSTIFIPKVGQPGMVSNNSPMLLSKI